MLKVIALMFERIIGLIFDLPPGSPSLHQLKRILTRDVEIGHPGKMLGTAIRLNRVQLKPLEEMFFGQFAVTSSNRLAWKCSKER